MATLAQIRNAVDAKLASLWGTIQTRQDAYAAAHDGRYWQGLRTATITPVDGVAVLPDVGQNTPTDQPVAWPAAILTVPLAMALQIDVYDGPAGQGYVATVQVSVLGQTYERAAQVGPETWRQYGWRLVDA